MSRGQKEDARRVRFEQLAAHEEILKVLEDICAHANDRVSNWGLLVGIGRFERATLVPSLDGAKVRGLRAVEGKRQRAVEDGKGLVFDRFGVALGVRVELSLGHGCGSEDALLACKLVGVANARGGRADES